MSGFPLIYSIINRHPWPPPKAPADDKPAEIADYSTVNKYRPKEQE
jgi:hypothetical protein